MNYEEFTLLRGLRGGSGGGGGGGGGGYGGGGGSYHYGNSNTSGGAMSPLAVGIMISVIVVIIVVFCIVKNAMNKPMPDEKFEEKYLKGEREKVEKHASSGVVSKGIHGPTSGTYTLSYKIASTTVIDRGEATLEFTPENGRGYRLSGGLSDEDGTAEILEGFVAYDGKTYWYDKVTRPGSRNLGLKNISHGYFDFEMNTFKGFWQSSMNGGVKGEYVDFYLTEASESNPQYPESALPPVKVNGETTPSPIVPVVPIVPAVPIVPVVPVGGGDEKFEDNHPVGYNGGNNGTTTTTTTSIFDQLTGKK